ncbi:MAG: hypothetical protein NTZ16_10545, partial [Verrucomicrobia bacterium]|nr:hypothetical protein [Verrucomicrobiota bacterium]
IISFVIYFRPGGKNSDRGSGKAELGSINGEPISLDDYRAVAGHVQLSYFLGHGDWPDHDTAAKQAGFNQEREIYQRLFLMQKMKALNIRVSREAVGMTAGQILRSFGRDGNPVPLAAFEEKVLRLRGLTVKDFNDLIEYEIGVRQMINLLGIAGKLTTEAEAEMLYRREHEELTTEAVVFSAANFTNAVTTTPERLGQFFTNQMARYRVPDRRQVSYVKFAVADYFDLADRQIASLTNLSAHVDSVYAQRGTNYYKGVTADAAKKEIRDEIRRDFALRSARTNAVAFAEELLNLTPAAPENLAKIAADHKLTAAVTAPFNVQAGPVELNVPPAFAKAAFARTAEEPFDGPILGEDGVYVIALKKIIPSAIPALDSIRETVAADYHFVQAAMLARDAGTNFVAKLPPGKPFADACAAAKVTPVKFPAFSLASRSLPEIEQYIGLGQLQEITYGLPTGATSAFIPTADGGLVLHVSARTPANDAQVKAELPAFLKQVRQTRQGEAFNAWFSREAATGLRDTPLARQQQGQR